MAPSLLLLMTVVLSTITFLIVASRSQLYISECWGGATPISLKMQLLFKCFHVLKQCPIKLMSEHMKLLGTAENLFSYITSNLYFQPDIARHVLWNRAHYFRLFLCSNPTIECIHQHQCILQQKMKAGSIFCIFVLCILYVRSHLIFRTISWRTKTSLCRIWVHLVCLW